jgi:hypothetical protein
MTTDRTCPSLHVKGLLHITQKSPFLVLHIAIHRFLQGLLHAIQKCDIYDDDTVLIKTDDFKLSIKVDSSELHVTVKLKNGHSVLITSTKDADLTLQGRSIEADLKDFFEQLFQLSKKKSKLPVEIKGRDTMSFTEATINFSRQPISFRRSVVKKK